MGPCAKQRVQAHAVLYDGTSFVGENLCLTPQSKCPRVSGEAYAKCITHCSQLGHAEEVLLRQLRAAGIDPSDISSIHVYGHTGPCDNCRSLLVAHNLIGVTVFHPDEKPMDLEPAEVHNIATAYNLYEVSSHSKQR